MIQETIGIVGVALLAISWIPQLIQTIKTKRSGLNLKFGLAQFIAGLLLLVYSYMIGQKLFIILNIIIVILISINLKYALKEKRK